MASMAGIENQDESNSDSATVELQNVGPIFEGRFVVKPLTVFTGPNGAGKTLTSSLLYILQKCLWNSFRMHQRSLASRLQSIEHSALKGSDVAAAQTKEINDLMISLTFRKDLETAFSEELSRAFTVQKNILKHGKRKARFSVTHSRGWQFECVFTASAIDSQFIVKPLEFRTHKKIVTSTGFQRALTTLLRDQFGGWYDRPIMVPAGRAGITDSYRYLAEQVLLERHGYQKSGPSGITRDFLAILVGASPTSIFDEFDDDLDFVSSIFDPLLGGRLRPSADPEELFTFVTNGYKVDRNVMSSMVKELGPMVVLLQQSRARGSVLIVDEPECHLHPRAQIALARAFVALVSKGGRFLLSTHSPYLAQSLSNRWVEAAREGEVQNQGMAVIQFTESGKGVVVRDIQFRAQYGFTFDEFTNAAEDVQEEFVELFN